jgi:murein L,D-transpeptidase YafK
MFRRLFVITGLLILLAAIGAGTIAVVRPELAISVADRSARLWQKIFGGNPGPERLTVALEKRLEEKELRAGMPVFIRIVKETSELEVWMRHEAQWVHFQTYSVCKWSGTLGPKLREGDGQSPEGFYKVTRAALNPNSSYHLSFNLGFPNAYDRAHGRTGSFLMVHGDCVSIGCYAMRDKGIEDIYGLVEAALKGGQKAVSVHVFPFRMTKENMTRHAGSRWINYWGNLKKGWHLFETTRQPPDAKACGKKYGFGSVSGPDCQAIAGL